MTEKQALGRQALIGWKRKQMIGRLHQSMIGWTTKRRRCAFFYARSGCAYGLALAFASAIACVFVRGVVLGSERLGEGALVVC